jgi:hypothetical protein
MKMKVRTTVSHSAMTAEESTVFAVVHLIEVNFECLEEVLRHCATSRKFTGSYPNEVIGFFN